MLCVILDEAPSTLNTINKLAIAVNNDPQYSTWVQNQLNSKQPTITAANPLLFSQVNGLQTALDSKVNQSQLDGLMVTPTTTIDKVIGLQTILDLKATTAQLNTKQDIIEENSLSISKVNNLSSTLANIYNKSEIAGLLNTKQDAIADNGLSILKVNNLQFILDSKASITQLNTKQDLITEINGISINKVTNLNTTLGNIYNKSEIALLLNGKQDVITDNSLSILKIIYKIF